jgi:hypothetical protein
MHMHYPLVGYLRNTLGSKTYLLKLARVLHNHTRKPILSLGYSIINTIGLHYWRGISHVQNHTIHMHYPLYVILEIHWVHNIFFQTWKGNA